MPTGAPPRLKTTFIASAREIVLRAEQARVDLRDRKDVKLNDPTRDGALVKNASVSSCSTAHVNEIRRSAEGEDRDVAWMSARVALPLLFFAILMGCSASSVPSDASLPDAGADACPSPPSVTSGGSCEALGRLICASEQVCMRCGQFSFARYTAPCLCVSGRWQCHYLDCGTAQACGLFSDSMCTVPYPC